MHTPFERTLRALATERRRAGKSLAGLIADRKSTRLNSSHLGISYAVFCLKKKSIRRYMPESYIRYGIERYGVTSIAAIYCPDTSPRSKAISCTQVNRILYRVLLTL